MDTNGLTVWKKKNLLIFLKKETKKDKLLKTSEAMAELPWTVAYKGLSPAIFMPFTDMSIKGVT